MIVENIVFIWRLTHAPNTPARLRDCTSRNNLHDQWVQKKMLALAQLVGICGNICQQGAVLRATHRSVHERLEREAGVAGASGDLASSGTRKWLYVSPNSKGCADLTRACPARRARTRSSDLTDVGWLLTTIRKLLPNKTLTETRAISAEPGC